MDALRQHLAALEPGPIDKGRLLEVLVPAWPSLDGGDDSAMHNGKLSRLEEPRWEPPHLYFSIERQGGTVLGSTRAKLQHWVVDITSARAEVRGGSYLQLREAAPRFDVKAAARELASVICTGSDDPRVEQTANGGAKVLINQVLPPAVRQTTDGRRRRFYRDLDAELAPEFVRSGATYRRAERR